MKCLSGSTWNPPVFIICLCITASKDAGLEVFVLNPIVTHAYQNINIRNIHNDKHDDQRITVLGLRPGLKTSLIPEDGIASVKALLRLSTMPKKEASMHICRLKNQLRQSFPQYLPIFSKVNGKASLEVLSRYPSPSAVLNAGKDTLAEVIQEAAGRAGRFQRIPSAKAALFLLRS